MRDVWLRKLSSKFLSCHLWRRSVSDTGLFWLLQGRVIFGPFSKPFSSLTCPPLLLHPSFPSVIQWGRSAFCHLRSCAPDWGASGSVPARWPSARCSNPCVWSGTSSVGLWWSWVYGSGTAGPHPLWAAHHFWVEKQRRFNTVDQQQFHQQPLWLVNYKKCLWINVFLFTHKGIFLCVFCFVIEGWKRLCPSSWNTKCQHSKISQK